MESEIIYHFFNDDTHIYINFRSFIQFPDMFEAQHMFDNTRNILNDPANIYSNEKVETVQDSKKNGAKPFHHVASSPKNPVMLLNEMQPGLEFTLLSETGNPHDKCFTMSVEYEGEVSGLFLINFKFCKQLSIFFPAI